MAQIINTQSSHGNYHVFDYNDKFFIYDIAGFRVHEIEKDLFHTAFNNNEKFIKNVLSEFILDKQLDQKNSQSIEPLSNITINISQICNLSCVYCYAGDGEYGMKGKMSLSIAKKCVDFLIIESRDIKRISITFFGGEPLLNIPVLKATTIYALEEAKKAKKRISFSITTNGTLFSQEINDFLNEHDFSVTISFDGDKKLQDKNRPFVGGKGSFDVILPLVKEFLLSRDGHATARATLTEKDTDVIELKRTLQGYGFKNAHAVIATVADSAKEKRGLEPIDLSDTIMSNVYCNINSDAEKILETVKCRKPFDHNLKTSKIYMALVQLYKKGYKLNFCGVGRKMVGIAINGDIFPCHRFVGDENFYMGNIGDYNPMQRQFYTEPFIHKHPECSKCWTKFFCGGGGCIQDNYIMMGNIEYINPRYCAEVDYTLKQTIRILSEFTDDDISYLTRK